MSILMFTRKAWPMLAGMLLAGSLLLGCETRPDPQEFGEIITTVPKGLNKPFPLPQLDDSQDKPKELTK